MTGIRKCVGWITAGATTLATALAVPTLAQADHRLARPRRQRLQAHAVRLDPGTGGLVPPRRGPHRTLAQLTGLRKELARVSPHLGGAVRSYRTIADCLGWPTPAEPVKAGAPVHGAPPALVLQSTHQALAPYRAGAAMAAQLPGSVVLGHEGDDHSMFLVFECVRKATNRCLTTRALPAPGTACTD
ncbi:alpha/beta hydrolase [Streptomyces sp. NPDC057950]|uniref:alpha/beta hydrolase n=1 Tax=Streptomyces sp. NPDC057950 TaxID=3346288 RepID=UPI0036E5A6BF